MKKIVIFGKRKFICELKKVKVRSKKDGSQENYVEKVFCKEIKEEKT